ncbi:MAG: heavy metal translocating P-type ATPase [Patescibacteria group bacterium]|nr:heavy metal translocating P-type ATPase [Patescibacteria group bacterium]
MQKIVLKIQGMHCASCAATIENNLKKQKGVFSASVNFASEKAVIEFNRGKINQKEIQVIIKKLGYTSKQQVYKPYRDQVASKEIKALKKKFLLSALLGLPVFYLAMGETVNLPLPALPENTKIIFQFFAATLIIIVNYPLYLSGFKKLVERSPNMDSLIATGTSAAYLYSLIVSLFIWLKPELKDVHFYFESAAMILLFISLGRYLEALTKKKTSQAVKKLIALQPQKATIIKKNQEVKIPVSRIKIGDIVLTRPGEKIAVDGLVIDGYSAVDQKAITGESIPAEKQKGDKVIGATINKTGVLKIKTTKIGKDMMISQIIQIVEQAVSSKAPIQLLADKIAFYFVPSVMAIAALSAFFWLITGQPLSFALTIFVAVLIIACPCALGLATPAAVMMGAELAAQNGILIKNSKVLEIARKINIFVFDKTGTLTKGKPAVMDIVTVGKNALASDEILRLAGSVEKNSEHPLARAIIDKAKRRKIKFFNVSDFKAVPGKGIEAVFKKQKILIGTKKIMADNLINVKVLKKQIAELENQGKTVIILALGKEPVGVIAITDALKKYSRQAIDILCKAGIKTAILTGDNKKTARAIAGQLNIDYVLAEVLPHEKSAKIKELQKQGNTVAMVGDGINDAPALAQADLGIALGSAADITLETGDMILIKNDLRDVIKAMNLSRFTLRKIKQNLFWAFCYNIFGIPLAAGALYPFTGWLLNPAVAAAAMAFSSVSVLLNALSMKRYNPDTF